MTATGIATVKGIRLAEIGHTNDRAVSWRAIVTP